MSELRKVNIARPNLYYVTIIAPGSDNSASSLVSMWCSAAHTPQVDILTNDSFMDNQTKRKYAYDIEFQNLVLTFYMDQDFKIKKYFDDWKDKIIENRRHFKYPKDYTADALKLELLNQNDVTTYEYTYNRVYPKTIQAVELSYANANTYATLTVEFVYETFHRTVTAPSGAKDSTKPEPEITEGQQSSLNSEMDQEFFNPDMFNFAENY